MNAGELLPVIREALSQHPGWADYPPERLAVALLVWHYTRTVPEAFEVEATLTVLDIERGAA